MSEELTELAKRRGFYFGSAGAYGGVGGFYTFGPQGAALKRNVEDAWRETFTTRLGNHEIAGPTVMPEPVFEASGHLDGFDDMLVDCPECGESHRADHLVESATDVEDAEALPIPEVEDLIETHGVGCPSCGAALAGQFVEEFNLMFETTIGPGDGQPGYLRPETAQAIFVEFPRLKEYARNQLPFGVTQIGPAYRNEISPRRGIVRTREFTQAELEQFVDPEDDDPPLSAVEDVPLRLYPAAEQESEDGEYLERTVREAVEDDVVGSAWVAYFLGVARRWYDRIGVDGSRLRFRQHLAGERAHYASDCWDAESEIDGTESEGTLAADPTAGEWIEIAGFSDRGAYDLSKHADHSNGEFTVFRQYDEPKEVERPTVDPDMSVLGPEYGGAAGEVADALRDLAERDPSAFDGESVTVTVDGEAYEVDSDVANFSVETVTEAGEHITPHVIEPSFGVDRTVYTLLAHGYREDEVDGEPRSSLSLSPEVAPTAVGVFPLVSNDDDLVDVAESVAADLRAAGLAVTYDESGNIGRRYRRQDEVGTPLCVTVDHEGLEGDDPTTVTVRDRDTTAQVRLPVAGLAEDLAAVVAGDRSFAELREAGLAVEG
ncbi:MAG: glycine--tRNA ligase [Haloferacaceae archaeon]